MSPKTTKRKPSELPIKSKISETEFFELKSLLKEQRYSKCVIASGSMRPLIEIGDEIVIEATEELRVFDILVFLRGSKLVCHYLKQINAHPDAHGNRVYVTSGLNRHRGEDIPITSAKVLGRVISHRLSGRIKAKVVLERLWERFSGR